MMKKWCALLLVLVLGLAVSACKVDPEKDAATVVAEVGGAAITKGEAQKAYDFVFKQMLSYYTQLGYQVDPANKDFIADVKATTLNMMAEGLVMEQKLDELGLSLTEADLAEIETAAVEGYDEMIETFMSMYGETKEAAVQAADEQGYTLEALRFFARRDKVDAKLFDVTVADTAVTEEDVQAKYDTLVAETTQTYQTSPAQFGSDLVSGSTIYVRPEGYRYVQNLVVGLPADIQSQIDEKTNARYEAMYNQYLVESQLAASEGLDASTKSVYEQLAASYAGEYTRLEGEISELSAQGREQVRAQAEEILAKCTAEGADFAALMAEYNIDVNTTDFVKEHGYPVSAGSNNYVPSFTEGAMALQNIGDISGLIESDYGFHILKYVGDVESGVVPLDEVKDVVSADLLATKREEVFHAKQEEWIAAAKVKTYVNKL